MRALITIEDGKMNLSHVATPSLDDDAVNKSYVDEAIAAAVANMPSATPKPANFSWLYGGESGGIRPLMRFSRMETALNSA